MREFFKEVTLLIADFSKSLPTLVYAWPIQLSLSSLYYDRKQREDIDGNSSFVTCCLKLLRTVRDDSLIASSPIMAKFFSSSVTSRCATDTDYALYIASFYRRLFPLALPHHSFYFAEHARVRALFYRFLSGLDFLLTPDSPYAPILSVMIIAFGGGGRLMSDLPLLSAEALNGFFLSKQALSAYPVATTAVLHTFFGKVAQKLESESVIMADVGQGWTMH